MHSVWVIPCSVFVSKTVSQLELEDHISTTFVVPIYNHDHTVIFTWSPHRLFYLEIAIKLVCLICVFQPSEGPWRVHSFRLDCFTEGLVKFLFPPAFVLYALVSPIAVPSMCSNLLWWDFLCLESPKHVFNMCWSSWIRLMSFPCHCLWCITILPSVGHPRRGLSRPKQKFSLRCKLSTVTISPVPYNISSQTRPTSWLILIYYYDLTGFEKPLSFSGFVRPWWLLWRPSLGSTSCSTPR